MFSLLALSCPFLVVSLQHTLSAAFSWHLTSTPTQCSNLAISIVGSDGQPPYRVLVIPSGATPLANNIDVRAVIDQQFDGDSTSISFPINYPANSHFVAVVSDATGFGTGGASVETMVGNSGVSSCFDPTKAWTPSFSYGVGKDNQLMQCQSTFVWWDSTKSQGTVSFVGVIPGGQSFKLPESNISTDPSLGTEFTWTPNIQGGTTVMIVVGDSRGMGTGGSGQFTVQSSSNTTCLNSVSPSSTSGVAAGSLQTGGSTSGASFISTTGAGASKVAGASATATGSNANNTAGASANNTTSNGGGGLNLTVIIPAAIGGGVGLLAGVALIIWCLNRNKEPRPNRPPMPYMHQVNSTGTNPEDALLRYQPEPSAFPGAGTYNHQYAYSGQGNAVGATSVMPPPTGSSLTSGSGTHMSDSPWYGQPPLQGDSSGQMQTSTGVMNGAGVYDASGQGSSRHVAPPLTPLRANPESGGGEVYTPMDQKGHLHLAPAQMTASSSTPLLTPFRASPESSGSRGGEVYTSMNQKGHLHLAPAPVTATSSISSASELAYLSAGPSTFPAREADMVPEDPPPAFTP